MKKHLKLFGILALMIPIAIVMSGCFGGRRQQQPHTYPLEGTYRFSHVNLFGIHLQRYHFEFDDPTNPTEVTNLTSAGRSLFDTALATPAAAGHIRSVSRGQNWSAINETINEFAEIPEVRAGITSANINEAKQAVELLEVSGQSISTTLQNILKSVLDDILLPLDIPEPSSRWRGIHAIFSAIEDRIFGYYIDTASAKTEILDDLIDWANWILFANDIKLETINGESNFEIDEQSGMVIVDTGEIFYDDCCGEPWSIELQLQWDSGNGTLKEFFSHDRLSYFVYTRV